MSSGSSSTAGSNAYSSDMVESVFLKRNRVLHLARLGLSFALLAGSIALIACEALPYDHYKSTVKWASSGLELWPPNFDIRPTIASISCACVIAVLNLVYFVVAILPSVSLPSKDSLTNTANISTLKSHILELDY